MKAFICFLMVLSLPLVANADEARYRTYNPQPVTDVAAGSTDSAAGAPLQLVPPPPPLPKPVKYVPPVTPAHDSSAPLPLVNQSKFQIPASSDKLDSLCQNFDNIVVIDQASKPQKFVAYGCDATGHRVESREGPVSAGADKPRCEVVKNAKTGKREHHYSTRQSPTGYYTAKQLEIDAASGTYNNSPMRQAIYLIYPIIAAHQQPETRKGKDGNPISVGDPASHGCFRFNEPDAKWLYEKAVLSGGTQRTSEPSDSRYHATCRRSHEEQVAWSKNVKAAEAKNMDPGPDPCQRSALTRDIQYLGEINQIQADGKKAGLPYKLQSDGTAVGHEKTKMDPKTGMPLVPTVRPDGFVDKNKMVPGYRTIFVVKGNPNEPKVKIDPAAEAKCLAKDHPKAAAHPKLAANPPAPKQP